MEPARLYCPAAQVPSHNADVAPSRCPNCPAGQSTHVPVVEVEYLPTGHGCGSGRNDPGPTAQYKPNVKVTKVRESLSDLKVPVNECSTRRT
jgi:hypothetical protein